MNEMEFLKSKVLDDIVSNIDLDISNKILGIEMTDDEIDYFNSHFPNFNKQPEWDKSSKFTLSILKGLLTDSDYSKVLKNTEKCGSFEASLTLENYTELELEFLAAFKK